MKPGPGMCPADSKGVSGNNSRVIPGADIRVRPGYEAGLIEKCFVWYADKHPGSVDSRSPLRGKQNELTDSGVIT